MARAHVTEELIKVVKFKHKKYPAWTQKELAEEIGCSAATVGRILAGKYDAKEVEDKEFTADTYDPKTGRFDTNVLGPNDTFETSMDDEIAAREKAPKETVFKIDTSNVARAELLKSVIDILAGASTLKPSVPATPIPEERFKYEVLTELKTIKEIEADTYKELKQLKGILADIRDMLK